ncbi:DNA glycosylase [Crepidotus variabilis]|uniref:DNA glycosylase n=1 Tax=Crepidotus variabilis TaxID=179855 RepID=A0A9P6EMF9_9AGAR|nr:DNA glycosylase [Crepidotus variabilis]
MPATRSSARLSAQASSTSTLATEEAPVQATPAKKATQKRKAESDSPLKDESAKKAVKKKKKAVEVSNEPPRELTDEDEKTKLLPPVLSFDFEEAKEHLIETDHRFAELFTKMKCNPYEVLEQVHPFRALSVSIIGQQIAWQAARSVTHKFIRLYDPSLPEKPTEEERAAITFFPGAKQVAQTDHQSLRSAGLSDRKAEYIKDLATRFADGRLSTEKLLKADDDELVEMLTEVRGIGRWTVDMFSIFSLRRPDILPVGDLGVQRGMLVWFLSRYSSAHNFILSPEKIGNKKKETEEDDSTSTSDQLAEPEGVSCVPPATTERTEDIPGLPPAFTPSIKKTLANPSVDPGKPIPPLPTGVTVSLLQSRLSGKKTAKKTFLTPEEMTALTDPWKPYRSLGSYYMWSLASSK